MKTIDRTTRPAARDGRRRAFTLAELLVCLGILLLLLSLLLPVLASSMRSARFVRCAAQMRGYGTAMALYANDNNGFLLPVMEDDQPDSVEIWAEPMFGDVLWENRRDHLYSSLLVCPEDPLGGDANPAIPSRNSYLLNDFATNHYGGPIRLHDTNWDLPPSRVVLMGEKHPTAVGWKVNFCYDLGLTGTAWYDEIDFYRHGEAKRSNHLFLDLHVDNPDLLAEMRGRFIQHPWEFWRPIDGSPLDEP